MFLEFFIVVAIEYSPGRYCQQAMALERLASMSYIAPL